VRLQLPPEAPNLKMNYPYPKKAILKYKGSYLDGGTKEFKVLNEEEIGLKYIYQDFRMLSSARGKFYTAHPDDKDAVEIIDSFIDIQVNGP
jgi:hypothetical protein